MRASPLLCLQPAAGHALFSGCVDLLLLRPEKQTPAAVVGV